MMRPARAVTTRQRVREVFAGSGFRWFFGARLVSQFGDGFFQIAAAAVLLFEEPGDNPVVTLFAIAAVTLIPFSVVGPFSGPFIDRWERRKIITRVPLLRALIAAAVPLTAAIWGTDSAPFYGAILFVLSANRFFLATMSAVLPQLVEPDDLLVANSVSSTGGSIVNVLGQASGSGVARFIGGTSTSALAAVTFGVSALVARRVPAHRGFVPPRAPLWQDLKQVAHEMASGVREVRAAPRVIYALSAIGMVQLLVGAMTGVLVWFFIIELRLDVGRAVLFLVPLSIGLGLGVVFVPVVGRYLRETALIPLAYVLAATGTLLAAIWLDAASLAAGSFVVGVAYAFAKIPTDTIVQEDMADAFRGRAFALYDMLFNVARVGGIGLIAFAYAGQGDTATLVRTIGAAALAAAVGFIVWERRIVMGSFFTRRRKQRAPVVGDLLLPGELVTVRSYAGARADEEPRVIVVGGHELPVDEIHWRATIEDRIGRARAFVVTVGGRRIRLLYREEQGWEIERLVPPRPALSGAEGATGAPEGQ